MEIRSLTRQQVQQVDRRAIEVYGIPGLVLMENAGRGCVDRLCALGACGPLVVCCGSGNNGGDGFVIARHLAVRGIPARVLLFCDPQRLRGDAATNFQILSRCGVPIERADGWPRDDIAHAVRNARWIVDALLGTGASGEPKPPLDQVIACLNEAPAQRLAVDLPSGLDCDSGQPATTTFRADHTCTFVAAKAGLSSESARAFVGEVHVTDIGVPWRVVEEVLQQNGR